MRGPAAYLYLSFCLYALDVLSGNTKANFKRKSLTAIVALFRRHRTDGSVEVPLYHAVSFGDPFALLRGKRAGWIRQPRPWRFTMKANGNRDFPCMLSLSEPFSEQGDHYHRKPEFDYVFFGPTFAPEVSSAPSLEREDARTALPKGKAGFSQVGCGLLHKAQ
jgi:hypothetical protein